MVPPMDPSPERSDPLPEACWAFWARCAASAELPATAAPSPGQFEVEYRRLAAEGATGIVVVSLSGNLSATIQSAELASRSVTEVPIEVVDSKSATLGVGLAAIAEEIALGDIGSGTPAYNDYFSSDPASFTSEPVIPVKSIAATSEASTSGSNTDRSRTSPRT